MLSVMHVPLPHPAHPLAAEAVGDRKIERIVSLQLRVKLVGDKPVLRQAVLLVGSLRV